MASPTMRPPAPTPSMQIQSSTWGGLSSPVVPAEKEYAFLPRPVRVFRAQGHAEGDHRQAQGSGRGGTGSSGRRSRLADLALGIFLRERRGPGGVGGPVKAAGPKMRPRLVLALGRRRRGVIR